jgi:hypothetical protein
MVWFGLWCLTPLSKIFQLYRGGHFFYACRKPAPINIMQFTLTLLNYPFNQDFIWISTNKCNYNVFSSIRTYCYSKEDLPEFVIYPLMYSQFLPVKPMTITTRIVSSNPVQKRNVWVFYFYPRRIEVKYQLVFFIARFI